MYTIYNLFTYRIVINKQMWERAVICEVFEGIATLLVTLSNLDF